MNKGKGIAKDNNSADADINYEDDGYNDDFEEDEEDIKAIVDALAGMEGAADAFRGADLDAPESSNVTRGVNIGARHNKKLKNRK